LSFVISSTTLSASTASLTVAPTSGPYGSSIALSTTGGSGTGAVTYTVTNGTNTGCSLSANSLSASSSGTCLVTATQASDSTHLGESSNVTVVNFFYLYPASYVEYNSTTTDVYSCPYGGSNPGNSSTCTENLGPMGGLECTDSGGSLSGGDCYVTYGATDTPETTDYYEWICVYGQTPSSENTCTVSGGSGPNIRHARETPPRSTESTTNEMSVGADSPRTVESGTKSDLLRPKAKHHLAPYLSSSAYVRKDHRDDQG
jgi:hypothetical protein